MKRILLVIFFIAIIFSIIIYNNKPTREKILFIGEKEYLENIRYNKYEKFLYDNINYKELINSIKNNDYIIIKNRKIYLNQLISDSDIILIGVNNIEYNKKCNNKNFNKEQYDKKLNIDKKYLINLIKKISYSKIIIIDNYCIK